MSDARFLVLLSVIVFAGAVASDDKDGAAPLAGFISGALLAVATILHFT